MEPYHSNSKSIAFCLNDIVILHFVSEILLQHFTILNS